MIFSDKLTIKVENLSKCYEIYSSERDRLKQIIVPRLWRMVRPSAPPPTYFREFWALQNISFEARPGETLGIIGRNGSGKSTLLQILAGTLSATSGSLSVEGRVAALLELGSGFNPEFTGRENVILNARILGLSSKEIAERYDRIVAFADIGDFIDQPVKTYSSGMFVRLAFAVQAHIDASVLIIDEALAVGDVFFRQKCYARLEEIRASGAAVLLVSHAMTDIEQFCDRAILLDHGRICYAGESSEAAKRYYQLHQTNTISQLNEPVVTQPQELTGSIGIQSPTTPSSDENWSANAAFVDASTLNQVGNGWARCLRYAVCDIKGNPCVSFAQGERAVFYYEFFLERPILIPLAGIVLQNDRGMNVHGKGSLEYAAATPNMIPARTTIKCRQEIELKLELGEYTFELGLASIDENTYHNMANLNHEQIFSRITRICHLPKAGVLAIGWRSAHSGGQLTHHGIADLPGSFEYEFFTQETR